MFPLLFAIGRRLPVVGDILSAFEGAAGDSRGRNRGVRQPRYAPPRPEDMDTNTDGDSGVGAFDREPVGSSQRSGAGGGRRYNPDF
jgi:hypothetical protein